MCNIACSLSPSSSIGRPSVTRASTFTSSTSTEELTPDHASVETADSGRGSWTSCSSNSHDNFQSVPAQRALLDLPTYRHSQLGGPIAEVEPGPAWAEDAANASNAVTANAANRHSRDSSELNPSRQSWASSSSLSDTSYEGNYGTIKRRAAEQSAAATAQGESSEGSQSSDASYKTVTSSTEKGLIGKAVRFGAHMCAMLAMYIYICVYACPRVYSVCARVCVSALCPLCPCAPWHNVSIECCNSTCRLIFTVLWNDTSRHWLQSEHTRQILLSVL